MCKNTFVDKSYRELACIDRSKVKVGKIDPISILGTIAGVFLIVLGSFDLVDPESGGMFLLFFLGGAFMLFGGIYTLCTDISSFDSRRKSMEQELAKSRQRLSNPAYAKALVKLGVRVPDEYLQPPPRKEEAIYYMEAANGMTVRVPESQLEAWTARQEELRKNPAPVELTEKEKILRDMILERYYGSKKGDSDVKP